MSLTTNSSRIITLTWGTTKVINYQTSQRELCYTKIKRKAYVSQVRKGQQRRLQVWFPSKSRSQIDTFQSEWTIRMALVVTHTTVGDPPKSVSTSASQWIITHPICSRLIQAALRTNPSLENLAILRKARPIACSIAKKLHRRWTCPNNRSLVDAKMWEATAMCQIRYFNCSSNLIKCFTRWRAQRARQLFTRCLYRTSVAPCDRQNFYTSPMQAILVGSNPR